jgi:predicted negative regulator of RcsB-dependent stress response
MSQEIPSTGVEKFLEDNFRKLVWLFVIVVLVICAYGFISHQSKVKANEAAEAFTAAKTVEDCDLVISRYSGTNAAANALLMKVDLLWDQNKKTSAIEALREFTTKHADHPLAVNALLGLGTKLDSMGDRKEAQAVFERITREFSSSEAAPLAQIRLGDILWAEGKQDEAKKAYEELAVKFADQQEFQSLGQDRLNWIAAALPTKEVDPPPAPKVDPKAAAPAIPGMPKINLAPGGGGLGATISPPGSPAAPAMPAAPAPAAVTTPAVPAPAAPATPSVVPPAPKPAPAPAPAPVTPAPAATPAVPAPAAPAAATPPAAPKQ